MSDNFGARKLPPRYNGFSLRCIEKVKRTKAGFTRRVVFELHDEEYTVFVRPNHLRSFRLFRRFVYCYYLILIEPGRHDSRFLWQDAVNAAKGGVK